MAPTLLLLLAACAARAPERLPPLTFKSGAACLADLGELQVGFERVAAPSRQRSCGIPDPLRIATAGTVDWRRPALASCVLAGQMAAFSREVVQPEAVRRLGQIVLRIDHLGTWDCRKRSGSWLRMSEHAHGNAIDVAAFELADGTRVGVAEDWQGSGKNAQFLHALARRACAYFNVVLTPDSDSDHWNHLHLDVGPERSCHP